MYFEPLSKCHSLVVWEWEWEGMGINFGNGTGMGIKSEAPWEWEWEWEGTDGNGREWECCKPFPHISISQLAVAIVTYN